MKKLIYLYDNNIDKLYTCEDEKKVLSLMSAYDELDYIMHYNLELSLYANEKDFKMYLINDKGASILASLKKKLAKIIKEIKDTLM